MSLCATLRSAGLDEEDMTVSIDLLVREIDRRARLGQGGYPYQCDHGGLSLSKAPGSIAYVFMLLLAKSPLLRKDGRQGEVEVLFDALVLDALREYLGPNCKGARFGVPADPDRPTNFLDALGWLADRMGLPLGSATNKPPKKNDGGVDVVVWRPFRDGRTGFIVVLAQCTVQLEWREKAKDITEDLWRGWIDFGKDPATCLAIPFVVPINYDKWDEVRRTVGIVLDRIRLAELLASGKLTREDDTRTWSQKEIAALCK
jgi:hypothetical protein